MALVKKPTQTTRHPEEQSDEGSASAKVLPPLAQIPPRLLRVGVRDDLSLR